MSLRIWASPPACVSRCSATQCPWVAGTGRRMPAPSHCERLCKCSRRMRLPGTQSDLPWSSGHCTWGISASEQPSGRAPWVLQGVRQWAARQTGLHGGLTTAVQDPEGSWFQSAHCCGTEPLGGETRPQGFRPRDTGLSGVLVPAGAGESPLPAPKSRCGSERSSTSHPSQGCT